jgi:D-aminoacyl-tRNA deacylase
MRAVIQRVAQAAVQVNGEPRAAIAQGLLILLGVETGDTPAEAQWLSGKISRLRIFSDAAGLMNRSVQDIRGGLLVVSQFTLLASSRKGNRPSFERAAPPTEAIPIYEAFLRDLAAHTALPIATGDFGADMLVTLHNDGPVTIVIDTRLRE